MRKFLLPVLAALALAACSSSGQNGGTVAGAGGATQQTPPAYGMNGNRGGAVDPAQAAQNELTSIGDRVYFLTDAYTLTPEGKTLLAQQVAWLNRYPTVRLVIEGHADERGTREYNLALGERRAQSVKNYLTDSGISPARLRTISYGKERPVAVGSDERSWAQNRRGVSVIDR